MTCNNLKKKYDISADIEKDILKKVGKFDRSRYDLLSPLSVFVPIDTFTLEIREI